MSMRPRVAVVVPWAGDCPYRVAAWHYIRQWYRSYYPSWEVVRGEGRKGSLWCKAEAVADALHQTSADILVIADADCIAPDIGRAVKEVADGTRWAMPHHKLFRFTEAATISILRGEDPKRLSEQSACLTQTPYQGYAGGGITVLSRDAYRATPLDPRFLGWGQEDESWAMALKLVHGKPWREQGPMWHLWHPPQQRMSRTIGSYASRDLRQQYRRIHSRASMLRFLTPARELLTQHKVPA